MSTFWAVPIVVFSHAIFEDGSLDYIGKARISRAHELAINNDHELIILWGKWYYCATLYDEGESMYRYLRDHFDISQLSIEILNNGTSSATQLIEFKEFCVRQGIKEFTVVTDKYHRIYASYMIHKIFWDKYVVHADSADIWVLWKFDLLLKQWFQEQLVLIENDRSGFEPGDHRAIAEFQSRFEQKFKK